MANSLKGLSVQIVERWLSQDPNERCKLDDCRSIITAFHNAVSTTSLFHIDGGGSTVTEAWKVDFWLEVLSVIKALQAEKLLHGRKFRMADWLRLRIVTISARPFMVLVRASLGLPSNLKDVISPYISWMQVLVQSILGLQNDLLGWQKDHLEGNTLNAVEVLIRDGMPNENAFSETLKAHNAMVRSLLVLTEQYLANYTGTIQGSVSTYIKIIVSFCPAMAGWMDSSMRYHAENIVSLGPCATNVLYQQSTSFTEGLHSS